MCKFLNFLWFCGLIISKHREVDELGCDASVDDYLDNASGLSPDSTSVLTPNEPASSSSDVKTTSLAVSSIEYEHEDIQVSQIASDGEHPSTVSPITRNVFNFL